jgi:hypothetical protein
MTRFAQDNDLVDVLSGVFLYIAGFFAVVVGVRWHLLLYVNTISLVVWLCRRTGGCAAAMSRLLTMAADRVQQHLPGSDDEVAVWALFSCLGMLVHMVYVSWAYPSLLVPCVTLCAVLFSSLAPWVSEDEEDDENDDSSSSSGDETAEGVDSSPGGGESEAERRARMEAVRRVEAIRRQYRTVYGH